MRVGHNENFVPLKYTSSLKYRSSGSTHERCVLKSFSKPKRQEGRWGLGLHVPSNSGGTHFPKFLSNRFHKLVFLINRSWNHRKRFLYKIYSAKDAPVLSTPPLLSCSTCENYSITATLFT